MRMVSLMGTTFAIDRAYDSESTRSRRAFFLVFARVNRGKKPRSASLSPSVPRYTRNTHITLSIPTPEYKVTHVRGPSRGFRFTKHVSPCILFVGYLHGLRRMLRRALGFSRSLFLFVSRTLLFRPSFSFGTDRPLVTWALGILT